MTLTEVERGIHLDDASLKGMPDSDAIIFDCDGVLIDITKSYDLAIRNTTRYVLENLAGVKDGIPVDSRIIDGFKSTGGFNDEVDLAYASVLSIVAAKRLGKDQSQFVLEVIANSTGIASVEQYLQGLDADIGDIRDKLAYPGPHAENPLYQIFDQMFYGPGLYRKLFGRDSAFSGPGLIENDTVLADGRLLDTLQKKFSSNIAIVTGRGRESARYSLKGLLDRFDLKNSVFLEDEPRELAKPNPEPLLRSIRGMGSGSCIYVGDSMEDLIMAKKSTELGYRTAFCGITGTSKHPGEKLALFERNGAQLALESISLLPKVLNLE